MLPDPTDELVDIVDPHGKVIGVVPRAEMRRRRLPHRCVYLLLFNSRGQLLIHLRTPTKDLFPSHWDLTVGGIPAASEPDGAAALREGREELGVELQLQELFPFAYSDAFTTVHAMVYQAKYDGPFVLQPEEIVCAEFVSLRELEHRIATEKFCPDGLAVWAKFLRRCPG